MSRILPIDDVIEISEWRAAEHPEPKTLFSLTHDDQAVRWFHVDVTHSEPDMIFGALEPVCPHGLGISLAQAQGGPLSR